MEKKDRLKKDQTVKGNSEDSLLVIYILRVLKKHSSPKKPLSVQDVMEYLEADYSIGQPDKSDSRRKKVRRHLDTLHESYLYNCIKKEEGKTRGGHKWYYDVSKDKLADETVAFEETLSEVEIEFLVDLVSTVKVLSSEGTRGLIDKLLRKRSISAEDRARRLERIQKEEWYKTPNEDLLEKKDFIEDCFYESSLTFDYEDEKSITAIPFGWSYNDGLCFLDAKVGDEYRKFSLDKIRICASSSTDYEEFEDFRCYDEETDSDKTTLDSLFVNIPTIKSAIADKKCIRFLYRSYAVDNDRVVFTDEEKNVLPHSLVFNNGKYYLIGIDENAPELEKIAYFRVDLMFEIYTTEAKMELSLWNEHVFALLERAREVEKHPLMLAGKDVSVTFKVAESALDRVIDAFATKPKDFKVTKETRRVKNPSEEGFGEESLVEVRVRTTKEEAFRWALANANVVELIEPQEIRDRIARIADPIYQLYTHSLSDKVRENLDYVLKNGTFKISSKVDADTAYKTYQELSKTNSLGVVNSINIIGDSIGEVGDYIGDFTNATHLFISAPELKIGSWASRLVNLETLDLTQIRIEDASWMKTMKKLRRVLLIECEISDLTGLGEHENIDYLDISDTNVGDISFIQNYQKLNYLNVVGCPTKDLSPLLTTKTRLKTLEIDEKSLEKIGEENIRNRHLGISVISRKNSPFWRLLI